MSDQLLPTGQMPIAARQQTIKTLKKVSEVAIKTLEQMEIEHIELALSVFENNKFQAATALGITTKTLYNKLHAYGLFEKYKA